LRNSLILLLNQTLFSKEVQIIQNYREIALLNFFFSSYLGFAMKEPRLKKNNFNRFKYKFVFFYVGLNKNFIFAHTKLKIDGNF
jgi:hypothetical protein